MLASNSFTFSSLGGISGSSTYPTWDDGPVSGKVHPAVEIRSSTRA